jgi:transcriptional regulator with XRE-family HTH domain
LKSTPPFLRRRLGKRLKALRESVGMSLEEAARRLDKSRTALHRVESGETRADVHLIRSMMDLYDQYVDGLIDEAREAVKPLWFRAYGVNDFGYLDVETHAVRVHEFGGLKVPGILQTEAHARALLAGSRRKRTRHQVDNDIKVRLIRQERLRSEDNPLELVAVLDEAALRREVGGPEVMREQVRHLIEVAALPTVSVQVLPLRGGAHSAMDGALSLLGFPDHNDPELLYIEHAGGALHIEDLDRVKAARLKFDQLRAEALSPEDSIELCEQVRRSL